MTHTRTDQTHNEGCVSSSYMDLELNIGDETVRTRGSRRTDIITSHLLELSNGRFACLYCNFESHDKTNVATHIGYIHNSSPCELCRQTCFNTCSVQEKSELPSSTEFSPIITSSFVAFVGDFSPRSAVDPKLDYIVKIIDGDITGRWL